jgi:hypothetical protein
VVGIKKNPLCVFFAGTKRAICSFGSIEKAGERASSMLEHMTGQDKKSSLKEQIDENLRRVYQDALNEEVPDRLKQLLEQLRAKEAGK